MKGCTACLIYGRDQCPTHADLFKVLRGVGFFAFVVAADIVAMVIIWLVVTAAT